jgi:hypothetical protein
LKRRLAGALALIFLLCWGAFAAAEAADGFSMEVLSVSSGQNGQEWKNIDKNVFTFWLESDPPDEIRQGTAQNYITIWKKGDFLPRALPETEAIWEGTPAQQ